MNSTIRVFVFCALIAIAKSAENNKFSKVLKVLEKDKNVKNFPEIFNGSFATKSLIMGTTITAKRMEVNILKLLRDIVKTFQVDNIPQAMQKYQKIQDTIERDKKSLEILNNALSLALQTKTLRQYRQALNKLSNDETRENFKIIPKDKKQLMQQLYVDVNNHVDFLRKNSALNAQEIPKSEQKKSSKKSEISSTPSTTTTTKKSKITSPNEIFQHETHNLLPLYVHMPIWTVPSYQSFYQRFRRQNEDDVNVNNEIGEKNEEEFGGDDADDEGDAFGGGGGLVGLIGNLSGGEGGSDVGALVGVLSGVISNLFGPGGLDVPSLLSTGTSLLAGLLGNDDNFGKVLANYIGITVEGLSGGGGADNNGEFFGNFVGALFAQLSADPDADEDEGAPPKPKIFLENFLKGFEQSKQKRGTNETIAGHRNYIFEFLSNIVSSVLGGVTNLILNASFGSSGGSSQGAADLSAGSSQGSHTGSAYASQSSAGASMGPASMHSSSNPKM